MALTKIRFPDTIQLGDVTKIDGAKIPPVDIICAGSPCLTADSLVLTMDGYKPITDVKVGELVLTKSKTWHKVLKKFDNGEHETCYISGTGFENIHCTLNHKFYARTGRRAGHFGKRVFSDPEFVQAKDLTTKHYIGLPIIETEKPFYTDDKDFWWMIGYYFGDGWLATRKYDIQLACNESKLAKLKEHLPREKYKYTVQDNRTCYKLRFSNKEIYNFIKQNIGSGCCEKHIPLDIINLPKEQLMQVYDGYLASDGCVVDDKHQFSSVNRRMIYEFMLIINKLFHKWACVYRIKTKEKNVIDGRIVNQRDWYQLRFSPLKKKQDHSFVEDGYLWLAFRKREMAETTNVYNMEIEDDHSYIVQGVISKNCQDLSVAGKREGLKGERSGLFRTAIDIVYGMRRATNGAYPRFFIWENVPGAFSSNKGLDFRAVLEEIGQTEVPMPANGKWAENGMAQLPGCEIAWRIIDAQWFVPQRRKRIFLVADFAESDRRAGKILFVEPSMSGNYPQGEGKGQGVTGRVEDGTGSAITLRERAGKPGGGKGPLLAIDKSGPLMANTNDQAVFQQKNTVYDMHHAADVIRTHVNVSPTLMSRMGTGGNNVPILTEGMTMFESHPADARVTGPVNVCPTVTAHFHKGSADTPLILNDQGGSVMNVEADGKVGTLRAEAHGNNPIVLESNQNHATITNNGKSPTLSAAMGMGGGHIPAIVFEPGVATRDGGHVYTDGKAPTLRANPGDNFPTVAYSAGFKPMQSADARGLGYEEEQSPTLVTGDVPAVVYGICSKDSNSMKSKNPHSGIYEADKSRTLDTNGMNPNCNQGGNVVVYAIEGNGARESHRGPGYSDSGKMYTLNTVEQHGVAYSIGHDERSAQFEPDQADPLTACDYKQPPVVAQPVSTGGGRSYAIGNGQTQQLKMSEIVGTLNCMHDQIAIMQPLATESKPSEACAPMMDEDSTDKM